MFVVSLVGQLFLSVYSNGIDKSSYTDWVSAFCNIIMAAATVGAVLTARNYVAQFTAQEGYKIAINLVNHQLPQVTNYDGFKKEIDKINDLYSNLNNGDSFSDSSITNSISNIQGYIGTLRKYKADVNKSLFDIGTYGLEFSRSKKYIFESMMESLDVIIDYSTGVIKNVEDFNKSVRSEFNIRPWQSLESGHLNISPNDVVLDGIKFKSKFILNNYDNVMDLYSKLHDGDRRITNLFVVC